jgi:hypothetical protein
METYWLSSIERCVLVVTPGCQIGYMEHTGCHQLNRVLTHNNNVVTSGIKPYQAVVPRPLRQRRQRLHSLCGLRRAFPQVSLLQRARPLQQLPRLLAGLALFTTLCCSQNSN